MLKILGLTTSDRTEQCMFCTELVTWKLTERLFLYSKGRIMECSFSFGARINVKNKFSVKTCYRRSCLPTLQFQFRPPEATILKRASNCYQK